jgi:hypothetical protein
MTAPLAGRVFFGSQDAERAWAGPESAGLPGLPPGPSAAALGSADELLLLIAGDADEVLCNRPPPATLLARLRSLGCHATVTTVPAGADDLPVEQRLAAGALPAGHAAGRQAVPYAVLPRTEAAVRALGADGPVVSLDVATRVNSKLWSNDLCLVLGLPGAAAVVRTAEELSAAAAATSGPLVLKSPHGVAGRGSLVIRDRRQLAVVSRRLDADPSRVVLVQPLLARAGDFSAHLDVSPGGGTTVAGFRGMTNRGLAFASSDSLTPAELDRLTTDDHYLAVLAEVGAALARDGYHGPVSVDGLVTEDGTLVPVLDVNARLSMGRYGLALEGRLPGRVSLRFADLPVAVSAEEADVLVDEALSRSGLRPGVVALTAATLRQPAGRLYYALHAADENGITALADRLAPVLAGLALAPTGASA